MDELVKRHIFSRGKAEGIEQVFLMIEAAAFSKSLLTLLEEVRELKKSAKAEVENIYNEALIGKELNDAVEVEDV